MTLFIKRGFAFLIDYVIVLIPTSVLILVFGLMKLILKILPFFNALSDYIRLSAIAFVMYVFYEVVFLMLFSKTIGKMILGLKIQRMDRHKLDFVTILLRSVAKIFSITGYFVWMTIINFLLVLGNNHHRSIHDLLAGTSVWKN